MTTPPHSGRMAASGAPVWTTQAELLNEMSRMAKVGGWEFDPSTGQGSWTDEVARIHELDPAQPADLQLSLSCYPGNSRVRMEQALQAALQEGRPYDLELAFRSTTGRLKWVRTIGRPVLENGRVVKLWGTLQDITERKRSEVALRLSEEKFAKIFHSSPDAILLTELESGLVVEVNEGFETLSGYARAEVLGRQVREFNMVTPAERERFAVILREQGHISRTEFSHRTKAGLERSVLLSAELIDIDGKQHAITTLHDITAHRQAELQVRHLNEVLRATRHIGHLIHTEEDPQRLLQAACQSLLQTRGYVTVWAGRPEPESKLVILIAHAGAGAGLPAHAPITCDDTPSGQGPTGLALRERRPVVVDDLATDPSFAPWRDPVLAAGAASIASVPLLHGDRLFGALTVKADRVGAFDAEEVRLLSALASDLALALQSIENAQQRRQAEQETLRLATAVEQASESIFITDTAGLIQYANPAFERISGYPRTAAIGRNPRFLKSGTHDEAFYGQLWETLQRGAVWTGQIIDRHKDGALFETQATLSPVRNASGAVTSYVSIQRDITAEVALQRQLIQSQKMEVVGQLAGGVAHDFNNILQTILGYSEFLIKNTPETDERHRDLVEIQRGGERAAGLTRQLLAFSRKQMLMPHIHDLNDIVVNLVKMLTRLIGENVQLKLDLAASLQHVKVDAGQMDQVLINLAINARDAMPQGGQLFLRTANIQLSADDLPLHPEGRVGDFVCLSLTDNGAGMSRDVQARIFEPFFTTKEQGKGTGLGLSTVYGIIKQHDGWLTVYSEPGLGATFRLYLPGLDEATAAPLAAATPAVAPPATGHGERLLIIEDDPLVRRMTQQLLNRRGYRAIAVSTCAEAQATFNGLFDLVVSDAILPDGNGLDLIRQLQRQRPNLHCILTSGYADIHERWPEIEEHRWPFLIKPYSQAELLRALATALA